MGDSAVGRRATLTQVGTATLLLLWSVTAQATEEEEQARLLSAARSIVQVEALQQDGRYATGTAVSVAPGKFLTSCHVIRDAQEVMIARGGTRWHVVSELSDTTYDLCVLDVPDLAGITPVPLGSARELRVGQTVVALGFTGGFRIHPRAGVIDALHGYHDSKVIQATAAFSSGASGGGLFDDQGRLVGILMFRLPGLAAYYFSAPVDWIRSRIARQSEYREVAPLEGQPFWARPTEALPYFLRAASLEAAGDWDELEHLTDRWSDAEAGNGDAWYGRGQALAHRNRHSDAATAFQTAVTLDPSFAQAWLALGRAYFRLGQLDDWKRVIAILNALDRELGNKLTLEPGQDRP